MKFKFVRTVQYTELIEVDAEDYESARELALEADGVHQNDDSVEELKLISK